MDFYYYTLFWVCVIGLCLGSFYNVVILRTLSNESIVFPASKCPNCGHKLYPWHNIPVLSYILLGGKCYFCKCKISIQYPLVELITMALFGLTFWKFGISIKSIFMLFWLSCLVIMTGTDLKAKLADCNFAIAMGIGGLIYNFISGGWSSLLDSFWGILIAVAVLEAIAWTGYLFVKSRAMGEADTYVAAAFGSIVGYQHILEILLYSFIASMLIIIPMYLIKLYKNGEKLTLVYSLFFIISICLYKMLYTNMFVLLLVALFGILLSVTILKSMGKKDNLSYLPYIPAFTVGFLYYMFVLT